MCKCLPGRIRQPSGNMSGARSRRASVDGVRLIDEVTQALGDSGGGSVTPSSRRVKLPCERAKTTTGRRRGQGNELGGKRSGSPEQAAAGGEGAGKEGATGARGGGARGAQADQAGGARGAQADQAGRAGGTQAGA